MLASSGAMSVEFEWIENWARIPHSEIGEKSGRTHGVEVTEDGRVIIFHQADPAILILDGSGNLLDRWGAFPGAHGLTLVVESGSEFLWLVDEQTKQVVKTSLEGELVQELPAPEHASYAHGGKFIPTWVAVNEERFGGNGDIWLADGYGSHLVHRYDKAGKQLASIDGTHGAGAFKCPHSLQFAPRTENPELYVTDRGNSRVQVFDGEGNFKRAFGEDYLLQPCAFAFRGNELLIPDLRGRVALADENEKLIRILGENPAVHQKEGWPNNRDNFKSGQFNSPHDATFDHEGNLYIVEWITGGRITKLRRL